MISLGLTAVGGGVGQALLQTINYSKLQWRTFGMDTRPLAPGLYWSDKSALIPPVSNEQSYIQRLLDTVEAQQLDMLAPGLDVELETLARHRDKFEKRNCTLVVAEVEAVRLAHDKLVLHDFCKESGLPFVQSYTVGDALNNIGADDFPVLVKPRRGKASKGVRLIHSFDELSELGVGEGLIVQEYLPSPNQRRATSSNVRALDQTGEWSIQFFVTPDGEIVGHFISVNTLKEGIPWEIVTEANGEVLEGAREIVEALIPMGLWGPINIQGRKTDHGVKFFEANARFTGITGVRASMGYRELDAAAYLLLHGDEKRAKESLQFDTGLVSTRHVDHTTIRKTRVLQRRTDSSSSNIPGSKQERGLGNVLVTGASGYIGINLIRHLLEQESVGKVFAGIRDETSIEQITDAFGSSKALDVVMGSLPDSPWNMEGVDTVVHLAAARPIKGESSSASVFYAVNVEGTQRLFNAAIAAGVSRFIFISSQSVYGFKSPPPWYESHVPSPESSYGLSKWIAEQVIAANNSQSIDATILRIAKVFGSGINMRWNNFPHNLVKSVVDGRPLFIYGTGDQRTDLVHIDDVCRSVLRGAVVYIPESSTLTINIGSGNPISISELVRRVIEKASKKGLKLPSLERYRSHAVYSNFGMDIRKARSILGWSPKVDINQAIDYLYEKIH